MLSEKHIKNICLGKSESDKCRYLSEHETKGCMCLKKSESAKIIDKHVGEFLFSSKNYNPHRLPIGDNCAGYPVDEEIEQGYDKDKSWLWKVIYRLRKIFNMGTELC